MKYLMYLALIFAVIGIASAVLLWQFLWSMRWIIVFATATGLALVMAVKLMADED